MSDQDFTPQGEDFEAYLGELLDADEVDFESERVIRALEAAGLSQGDLSEMRELAFTLDVPSAGHDDPGLEESGLNAAVHGALRRASGIDRAGPSPAPRSLAWVPWAAAAAAVLALLVGRGLIGGGDGPAPGPAPGPANGGARMGPDEVDGTATLDPTSGALRVPASVPWDDGLRFEIGTRLQDGTWKIIDNALPEYFRDTAFRASTRVVEEVGAQPGAWSLVWFSPSEGLSPESASVPLTLGQR